MTSTDTRSRTTLAGLLPELVAHILRPETSTLQDTLPLRLVCKEWKAHIDRRPYGWHKIRAHFNDIALEGTTGAMFFEISGFFDFEDVRRLESFVGTLRSPIEDLGRVDCHTVCSIVPWQHVQEMSIYSDEEMGRTMEPGFRHEEGHVALRIYECLRFATNLQRLGFEDIHPRLIDIQSVQTLRQSLHTLTVSQYHYSCLHFYGPETPFALLIGTVNTLRITTSLCRDHTLDNILRAATQVEELYVYFKELEVGHDLMDIDVPLEEDRGQSVVTLRNLRRLHVEADWGIDMTPVLSVQLQATSVERLTLSKHGLGWLENTHENMFVTPQLTHLTLIAAWDEPLPVRLVSDLEALRNLREVVWDVPESIDAGAPPGFQWRLSEIFTPLLQVPNLQRISIKFTDYEMPFFERALLR